MREQKKPLPLLLGAAEVAERLNTEHDPWDVQRARRWLKSTTAAKKRGRFWVTTIELLQMHFPEIVTRLEAHDDEKECAGCLKLGHKLREAQDQVRDLTNRLAKRAA